MNELTGTAARAALAEFAIDLEKVEQLLGLIHDLRGFAATAEYTQEAEGLEYARKLWTTAQEVRTYLPVLSGSLLLYLCGRFENFVRDLVGSIVDELVDEVGRFDDLPEALRREYLTRTLSINLNPAKFNHTSATAAVLAAELADNLAGNGDTRNELRVDSSVITITESNMNPGTIADVFKRVGITSLWDSLGKQSTLKAHLGEATDVGCKKAAIVRLDDVMNERNKIAHPTQGTAFPDAESVQNVAQFFRILSQALVDLALVPRQPV